MEQTTYLPKTLLWIGIAIAFFQLSFIGLVLFGEVPPVIAVTLKVALFGSIAAFVVVGARAVRRR